jgi:hypothetical protein
MKQATTLPNLTYREFLALVRVAEGRFSYVCLDHRGVCDPVIYIALNWSNGLPAVTA